MPFPKFKKLDEIPEAFRSEYEEKDGEWIPKVATPEDDGAALKLTLKKERDRAEAAEKKHRDLERKIAAEELKRSAGEQGLSDEKLNELRAKVKEDLEKEYLPLKTEVESGRKDLRELRLDSKIKTLMGKKEVGVKATRFDALWRLVGDRFDLTTDGKPMVKDHPGIEPEKYLADVVKKEYGEFYEGTQGDGGGAGGVAGGGTPAKVTFEQLGSNPAAALQEARAGGAKE